MKTINTEFQIGIGFKPKVSDGDIDDTSGRHSVSYLGVGELFAGAGGMALGASWAEHDGLKLQHAWSIDNNYHRL